MVRLLYGAQTQVIAGRLRSVNGQYVAIEAVAGPPWLKKLACFVLSANCYWTINASKQKLPDTPNNSDEGIRHNMQRYSREKQGAVNLCWGHLQNVFTKFSQTGNVSGKQCCRVMTEKH